MAVSFFTPDTFKIFRCFVFTYKYFVSFLCFYSYPLPKINMIKIIFIFCSSFIRWVTINNAIFWYFNFPIVIICKFNSFKFWYLFCRAIYCFLLVVP